MADTDYSYATWVSKGRPGGDFTAWQKAQPGYGTTQTAAPEGFVPSNGSAPKAPGALGSVAPADFDARLASGEFAGKEGEAINLEVRRRRALIKSDGPPLPPDLADVALRDVATGRLRRARGGSTSSALGFFNPTQPLTGNY